MPKSSVTLGLLAEDGGGIVPAGKVTIPPNHRIPAVGQVCETRYLCTFRESGSIYQPVYGRTSPPRTSPPRTAPPLS